MANQTVYTNQDTIPLSFNRVSAGVLVTGLTVTLVIKNASTGATMLASTSVPEVGAPSGIYTYQWTHGLQVDTEVLVTYTVGSAIYTEYLLITNNTGSRTA